MLAGKAALGIGGAQIQDADRLLAKARTRLAAKELFIAKFYADRHAWGAVRGRTEDLVRTYPDTPRVPDALALWGVALHRWGRVNEADQVRAQLAERSPDSGPLHRLDHELARPAGTPPDEKIFVRPYKIRGVSPVTGQPY